MDAMDALDANQSKWETAQEDISEFMEKMEHHSLCASMTSADAPSAAQVEAAADEMLEKALSLIHI